VSDVFVGAGLFSGEQAFHVPGTVLTVDLRGRRPRTYVAGWADVRDGRVFRRDDPQPVRSGTKPMTALLVLELVRRCVIGIDDRLSAVAAAHRRDGGQLARLTAAHRRRLRGITVRELLNMSSGRRDYDDDARFGRVFARSPRAPRSMARLAAFGLARPRLFRPGAPGRTYYSNTNYVLAGMIVEAVTGRSFASRLRALFRRAGMRRSSYYFALGLQRQDVAQGAFFSGSPPLRIWMKLGDTFGYTSASYYVEGPRPYGGVVVTNVTNLFPSPVGDLGVLRDTLRALRG
jgi:CubicO group peptidase (beta-lactamase class C family)